MTETPIFNSTEKQVELLPKQVSEKKSETKQESSKGTASAESPEKQAVTNGYPRRLGRRLFTAFIAMGVIPLIAVSVFNYQNARESLRTETEKNLKAVVHHKTNELQAYFDHIITHLEHQTQTHTNRRFFHRLMGESTHIPPETQPTFDGRYPQMIKEKSEEFLSLQTQNYYTGIYLIDSHGRVLLSVGGGIDPGTRLFTGQYGSSHLVKAVKKCLEISSVVFSDFEISPAAGSKTAGFMMAPILSENKQPVGVLVFQIPIDAIDKIMHALQEPGSSARTYLVGSDLKLRGHFLVSGGINAGDKIDTKQTRSWLDQIQQTPDTDKKNQIETDATEHHVRCYHGPHGKHVMGVHQNLIVGGIPYAVIAEIDEQEAVASADRLLTIVLTMLAITVLVVFLISLLISKSIVTPIRTLSSGADRVARGDLDHEINIKSKNEIGKLADRFNNMVGTLRRTIRENETKNRLMTGQAELNEQMRGQLEIGQLGKNIISYICRHLDAQVGTIYMMTDSGSLKRIAGYAFNPQKQMVERFNPGQGLVGQAAVDKKPIMVTDCPVSHLSLQSSLGKTPLINLLVYPLMVDNRVKGVMEIGTLSTITEYHPAFLDQVQEGIASALNSAISRNRTAILLRQTQDQARELRRQQEELHQANEELEEHAEALERSEALLQAQHEQLQQSNRDLEEHAQQLEEQKIHIENKNRELERIRQLIEEKAQALETSNQYKTEFLANMSHELRTPLNSILLLSKLMFQNKDDSLPENHVENAENIYTSAYELLELINDVLDLARIEAGKPDIQFHDMELKDFANELNAHFKHLAKEKGLEWKVELAEDLPAMIRTDRKRCRQIVNNFLSNSFKFTIDGSVTLRIGYNIPSNNSGHVPQPIPIESAPTIFFSVIDTGTGIPKDKQRIIFEAFQQVDGTTTRRHGGVGLGLSISKELAKLLGGFIDMQSQPGKGSTFSLYIPENPVSQGSKLENGSPRPQPPQALQASETDWDTNRKKTDTANLFPADDRDHITSDDKSVLIIEDDANFCKVLMHLAKKNGFKCLVAGDGETGLQLAEFYKPQAILLDITLPGIKGWGVMARLKENLDTRHIPVHFITAADKPLEAMKMGAASFLTKPVSQDKLENAFQQIDSFISKSVKDLLLVQSHPGKQEDILSIIKDSGVAVTHVTTGADALQHAVTGKFDCMILDVSIPDMTATTLLEQIRSNPDIPYLPIIVYSERELDKNERSVIDQYTQSTICRADDSNQRILDDTTLFLHQVGANLPEDQQKILRMLHDREAILSGKKILLVDDDMRNVFSLKKILGEKGMTVVVGKNGKEGLHMLEQNPNTHLVLMDIMMPEMDGYEAIERIRRQKRYKKLPVIALTAKAMKGDRTKCIEAGANDYLAKPIDIDRLFSMLRVWLY